MRKQSSSLAGLAAGLMLIVGCSEKGGDSDAGTTSADGATPGDGALAVDGSIPSHDGAVPTIPDTAGACCPAGFQLYDCQEPNGQPGLACHNPALGCASSTMCGQGCDPQVVGRCECVEDQLCMIGQSFDRNRCTCVPKMDGGSPDESTVDASSDDARIDLSPRTDAACVETVLCIRGDTFDRSLCRCVPNSNG